MEVFFGWFGFGVFNWTVEVCLCFTAIVREPEFRSVSGIGVGSATGPFFSWLYIVIFACNITGNSSFGKHG